MDKITAADVKAYVGAGFAVAAGGVAEKNQIAGLKIIAGYVCTGGVPLGCGGVGQAVAVQTKHIHGKAGTVKALGGSAAIDIPGAYVLLGGNGNFRTQAAAGRAGVDPQEIRTDIAQLAAAVNSVPVVFQGSSSS